MIGKVYFILVSAAYKNWGEIDIADDRYGFHHFGSLGEITEMYELDPGDRIFECEDNFSAKEIKL